MTHLRLVLVLVCTLGICNYAEEPAKEKPKQPKSKAALMDYGRFISYFVARNPKTVTNKGIVIKLGDGNQGTVCFDTDLLRYDAGWTGSFIDLSKTNYDMSKGSDAAVVNGPVKFHTAIAPGCAKANDFSDPRPGGIGPLPVEWAHYKGLYVNGNNVVLSYSVGRNDLLDLPGVLAVDGETAFTRTIKAGPTQESMKLAICTHEGTSHSVSGLSAEFASLADNESCLVVGEIGAPKGRELAVSGSTICLTLPPLPEAATFKIVIWSGAPAKAKDFQKLIAAASPVEDPSALCKGGPPHWPAPVVTQGVPGKGDGPFVADTLTLPEPNPWHSWMRPGGFDFFSDGRAAVCTLNGDVWIVSGLDDNLEKITWKRYATGLFEPLGLKISGDTIYVLGRDQITRLHDLNNDGEADYYENFNNMGNVEPSYHAFSFDLHTDSQGNFFYITDGNQCRLHIPLHGDVLKVSRDGSSLEVFATGLRAANGFAVGPNDEVVSGDNQGHWVPSSRINWITKGGFYGYCGDPRKVKESLPHPPAPKTYDAPLCWIPMSMDNSCGGQVFVTSDKFGPYKGHFLHTSYGKCWFFDVLVDKVGDVVQGGVVKFPLSGKFDSGIMRGRFNPKDGQLYLCGLHGWQSASSRDGCFNRVRYTGKPVYEPIEMHVKKAAIAITFTCELDPASLDEQTFGITQWNYNWTEKYGSPEFSAANPTKEGHDPVAIKAVHLSADKKTVTLEVPELRPVMQMKIECKLLKAADGTVVKTEIYNTINKIPE